MSAVLEALGRAVRAFEENEQPQAIGAVAFSDANVLRELRDALASRVAFVCVYPGNKGDGDWWRIVSPGAPPCDDPCCSACVLTRLLSTGPPLEGRGPERKERKRG